VAGTPVRKRRAVDVGFGDCRKGQTAQGVDLVVLSQSESACRYGSWACGGNVQGPPTTRSMGGDDRPEPRNRFRFPIGRLISSQDVDERREYLKRPALESGML